MPETDFSIRTFKGGFDNNLSYLVSCLRTGNQLIVDAALPLKELRPFINRRGLIAVMITHTHGDHIQYLKEYVEAYPNLVAIIFKESKEKIKSNYIKPVTDQEIVTVGQLSIEIIHTPGHHPDSLCFYIENVLFTGDTLFVGRTGRSVGIKSNTKDLYHSVFEKIMKLPKDTVLYPGHDYGKKMSITLEENIKISSLLQAKDEKDFLKKMKDYEKNRTKGS